MDKRKNTITPEDAIEHRLSQPAARTTLEHFQIVHELHSDDQFAARTDAHTLWTACQRVWINRAGYSEARDWWQKSIARNILEGGRAADVYRTAELILLSQAKANGYERDNSLKLDRGIRLNQMYSVIKHNHEYQLKLGVNHPKPVGLSEIGRGMGLESRSPHFYEMLEDILGQRNVYAAEVPASTPAGYKRVFGIAGFPVERYRIEKTKPGCLYKFEGDADARIVYRSRK